MNYFRSFIFALFFVLAPCSSATTLACVCKAPRSNCATFQNADAVFIGKVMRISAKRKTADGSGVRDVYFSVQDAFRGVQSKTIKLQTEINSCTYGFRKGKTYFVYADNDAGNLDSTYCSGTKELQKADDDLAFAKNIHKLEGQSIGGVIMDDFVFFPLSGIEILVRGNNSDYSTVTDNKGYYKLDVDEPGKYKINFSIPNKFPYNILVPSESFEVPNITRGETEYFLEYEVEVKEKQCTFVRTGIIRL